MDKENKDNLKILGKNIKRIRVLKGLSQDNLATDLQKSINFISLLEDGKSGLSFQTIINLCYSLEVDTNTIFSGIVDLNTKKETDSFIIHSLKLLNDNDKKIIVELINYITRSKL